MASPLVTPQPLAAEPFAEGICVRRLCKAVTHVVLLIVAPSEVLAINKSFKFRSTVVLSPSFRPMLQSYIL